MSLTHITVLKSTMTTALWTRIILFNELPMTAAHFLKNIAKQLNCEKLAC